MATRKFSLILLLILIICINCGVPQHEYEKVKQENDKLRSQLDEVLNGPVRLLQASQAYIDSSNYSAAKKTLDSLIYKHPHSPEGKDAIALRLLVENKIQMDERDKEKARSEKEKKERERIATATKKLRTSYDDVRGITWYYDRMTPRYTGSNSFHLYMGKEKSGDPWLRLRIQYASDDWLFIEGFIIKTDTDSYTITASSGDIERDNDSDGIREWYDVTFGANYYNMMKDILASKHVKLRYNGDQYYHDKTITSTEKQAMKNIINAFDALGGKPPFGD